MFRSLVEIYVSNLRETGNNVDPFSEAKAEIELFIQPQQTIGLQVQKEQCKEGGDPFFFNS